MDLNELINKGQKGQRRNDYLKLVRISSSRLIHGLDMFDLEEYDRRIKSKCDTSALQSTDSEITSYVAGGRENPDEFHLRQLPRNTSKLASPTVGPPESPDMLPPPPPPPQKVSIKLPVTRTSPQAHSTPCPSSSTIGKDSPTTLDVILVNIGALGLSISKLDASVGNLVTQVIIN